MTLDAGGLGTDSTDVTLAGGNSTTETLSVATTDGDAGTYTATVSTANDTASTGVTVQTPANFSLSSLRPADVTVDSGTAIDIAVDVTNVGDVQATQDITLSIDGFSQTRSETLAGGANTTVTFTNVDTGVLGPGAYAHTVTTANDSVSGTLQVRGQATVELRPVEDAVRVTKPTTVQVVVVGASGGIGAYDLDISLNDTVASLRAYELTADGAGVVDNSAISADNASVSLNATLGGAAHAGSAETTIANLTLRFDATGAVRASSAQLSVDDTDGISYNATGTAGVVSTFGPPPIVENRLPLDPNNDGLYENIRSSSEFTILDVQALFNNLGTATLQNNSQFFAFFESGNPEEVTILDVQGLFNRLAAPTELGDYQLSNLDPATATVTQGESLDISVDVTNADSVEGSQPVELTVGGVTRTQEVRLGAGASTTVTFEGIDTGALAPGQYSHEIATANDTASGTLTVQQPATFAVSNLQPPSATVETGATVDISATVENVGDLAGTKSVELTVDGFSETRSVTLNASETTTVQFQTLDTAVLGAGTYSHEVATADSAVNGTLTVQGGANFQLSNLDPAEGTAPQGGQFTVSAIIENIGDEQGTQTVTFQAGSITSQQSIPLDSGNFTPVEFTVDVSALAPGTYTQQITTANDTISGNLTVQEPADFQVSGLSPADVTVAEGDLLDISATVENVGDAEATQTVELSIDGFSDTATVTLAGGANQSVTFQNVDTALLGPGAYTHTVATANDSASGNLTVQDATTVELRPVADEIRATSPATVQVVVAGAGDGISAYDIDLSLNDTVASVIDYELTANGTGVTDNSTVGPDNASVSLNATLGGAAHAGSSEVTVANLTVRFNDTGTVRAAFDGATVFDTDGQRYDATGVGRTLSTTGPPPVVEDSLPLDPIGNGLYADVRGDNNVNILDVQALFNNLETPAVQENAEFFKFAGANREGVDILDVQALFNRLD